MHRTTQKKILNDPGDHEGVVTHLEPDILECEDLGCFYYEQS